MKIVVLDTSAIIRLYIPDGELPDTLEEYIDSAWKGETILTVPELALAEIAQVLWKKEQAGYISQEESGIIMSAILELPLETVAHRQLLHNAMAIARCYYITVYDALFIALSDSRKADLVTADNELAKNHALHVRNGRSLS